MIRPICISIAAVLAAMFLGATITLADPPATYSQAPEIVPSTAAGLADSEPEAPNASTRELLSAGPQPIWIWGANQDKKYFLRKKFNAAAKRAWVILSCDNQITLSLNGNAIAQSDNWETPTEVSLDTLQIGENTLQAEISNSGGPAGFLLKLVVEKEGGAEYVVTDKGWEVCEKRDFKQTDAATELYAYGEGPWQNVFENAAAARAMDSTFNVPPGFQVERLFTVPKEELGSWVNITVDPKGRLIASDQEGKGLCRITPPAIGGNEPTIVERLPINISAAQGLLFAFDSLYVSVNGGIGSGLYRVRDTNGDDQFDEIVKLKDYRGGGEHGPHALLLSPDGKSITCIAGNHTLPPFDAADAGKTGLASTVPANWNEDHILPRQWDANGHAVGIMAPGGWIAKTDPDGKTWEILSIGYRNPYDMAYNADGELFAYDADMEWDLGAPWYRPTRVTHAVSGSEFGWRSGTGKWPAYYIDSLPPTIDIGPGSPVGVTFGYGARFPARFQKALYLLDWTFGTMYAVHLAPSGAGYTATKEEFLSRTPLPLTDAVVGLDGAMYFTVGGRGAQSELYRVTYIGDEPTDPAKLSDAKGADQRAQRRKIEAFHRPAKDPAKAVAAVWPSLSSDDRNLRYAARVALEHQPVGIWQERVLMEKKPLALLEGAVALARQGKPAVQPKLLAALARLEWSALSEFEQLALLRVYSLAFLRLGAPNEETAAAIAARLDAHYPAASDSVNRELCNVLVYLQSPNVVSKTMAMMATPHQPPPDSVTELLSRNPGYGGAISKMLANRPDAQNMHYAFALRNAKVGWTLDFRKQYFQWLKDAQSKSGGASYPGFLRNIDREAFDNATDAERLQIEATGAREPYKSPELPRPHGPGRDWNLAEVLELSKTRLENRDFANGQRAYAAARCAICHRFAGEGGATGPDLTQAAGRFSPKEIAEAILEPSKVISDQYKTSVVQTKGGQSLTGRVLADSPERLTLLTDPENPTKAVVIEKSDIEEMEPSKVSVMPADLLKPLNEDEVLDLIAYVLSRGNPKDPRFKK